MKAFVRRHPFLCLAILTIALGAAFHALSPERRAPLTPVMNVIGAPFITGMRLSRDLGSSPLRPLVGTLLGLVPYLLADWLLSRVRARRAA